MWWPCHPFILQLTFPHGSALRTRLVAQACMPVHPAYFALGLGQNKLVGGWGTRTMYTDLALHHRLQHHIATRQGSYHIPFSPLNFQECCLTCGEGAPASSSSPSSPSSSAPESISLLQISTMRAGGVRAAGGRSLWRFLSPAAPISSLDCAQHIPAGFTSHCHALGHIFWRSMKREGELGARMHTSP